MNESQPPEDKSSIQPEINPPDKSKNTSAQFRYQEIRPAHLMPEIVQKLDREDIKSIVKGFNDNTAYANETDRMAMNRHYDFQSSADSKRLYLAGFSFVFIFVVEYFSNIDWKFTLFAFVFFNSIINGHSIVNVLKSIYYMLFGKK